MRISDWSSDVCSSDLLSLTVEHSAWAIHLLATNKLGRALRSVSIERGRDPRDYAMVAFGGAGPLHAARLARQETGRASVRERVGPYLLVSCVDGALKKKIPRAKMTHYSNHQRE